MRHLLRSPLLTRLSRHVTAAELLPLAIAVGMLELLGSRAADDLADVPWVLLLPLLFMTGCSVVRHRRLPLTARLLEGLLASIHALRARLVLSLGLDFHPERQPRLAPFTTLRRAQLAAGLAIVALWSTRGLLLDVLQVLRAPGLYTAHVLLLGAVWVALVGGLVVQAPAIVLGIIEVLKGRSALRGAGRAALIALLLVLLTGLLAMLDASAGLAGAAMALAFGALIPSVAVPVEPPGGPWLNIAFGKRSPPRTVRLADLIRDSHRLFALEALLVVCALAPSSEAAAAAHPVTVTLLRLYAWTAVWLVTGGALLGIAEFNRRRRLHDPAFERSRVLWASPGPETSSLLEERPAIEAAGWRLVVSEKLPGLEDADLLVGLPSGLAPPSPVPLARVPAALFLLGRNPGAVLCEADERDKLQRALAVLERLLTSTRPRFGERGEGTFFVPQCWLVVGLTRDDDRPDGERPAAMSFGQSYQAALGTRLRRFFHEVMSRAGIDVIYVEDAVTPQQAVAVIERLFERHVARAEPGAVSEADFSGQPGVHVVLHDVVPEREGLPGVDAHVARNAISRARILIIGRERRDGGDDDGPPTADESSDQWLKDALRNLFPRLQPAR